MGIILLHCVEEQRNWQTQIITESSTFQNEQALTSAIFLSEMIPQQPFPFLCPHWGPLASVLDRTWLFPVEKPFKGNDSFENDKYYASCYCLEEDSQQVSIEIL